MGGPGSGRKKGSGKNTFARKNEPRVVKQTKYATNKKQTLVKSKKTGNYKVAKGGSVAISRRLKGPGNY